MNAFLLRLSGIVALTLCLTLLAAGCADQAAGFATPEASQVKAKAADQDKAKRPSPFVDKPTFEDHFNAGWEKTQKDWRVATWKQNKTQMSPERCRTDGKGHMVQTILGGKLPGEGGSMQTAKEYPYGRWVARLKPSNVPGALNTMFTKDWDDLTTKESTSDGTGFEVDIELLTFTFGPKRGKVHLAIHAKGMKSWSEDLELKFNPSDDFHEWGFDIFPDRVEWHVDGKHLKTWKAAEGTTIPVGGHEFFFNSWTTEKWIKGPPKTDAIYLIDWVKFYPLKEKKEEKK